MSPKTKTTITAALVLAALTTDALAQQRRAHDADLMGGLLAVLVLAAILFIYFLPKTIARGKDHPGRATFGEGFPSLTPRALAACRASWRWSPASSWRRRVGGAGWLVVLIWALVGEARSGARDFTNDW